MELNRECRRCGASSWTREYDKSYPERRNERDRTVKIVYSCDECGAEGRYFEHNGGGPETMSGALR